jgi:hypothetical protein
MERRSPGSTYVLVSLSVALSAFHVAYVALRVPSSEAANLLTSYSLSLFLIWWVVTDVRRERGHLPCHDFGFLIGITLPISLAWYLIWSRGWKGLLSLAFFGALMYLPWLATAIAWLILRGEA